MSAKFLWPELTDVLDLTHLGEGRFRSHLAQPNHNGRIWGGQLLGQMAAAAIRSASADRTLSMLQMVFLHGARIDRPLDLVVAPLQQGRRFSSFHIRGEQGDIGVVDGNASFQVAMDSSGHQPGLVMPTAPEDLPDYTQLDSSISERLNAAGFAGMRGSDTIDFRLADPRNEMFPTKADGEFRFWFRVTRPLPEDPNVHVSALAYLSDWWLCYASIAPYLGKPDSSPLYIASLNHTIWFHAPCKADEWMLCVTRSLRAGSGRGLTQGQIWRRDGTLVATTSQECLQVPRETGR